MDKKGAGNKARKSRAIKVVAATSIILGGSIFAFASSGGDRGLLSAAVGILRDPLKAFDLRSPGARQGALTQTKERLASRTDGKPHERVLSEVRERPAPPADIVPLSQLGEPGALGPALAPIAPLALALPTGAGQPPVGGTGTPASNLPPVPLALPPKTPSAASVVNGGPTSAVPEPATWALLLVGFMAVGWVMRRNRDKGTRIDAAPDGER